MRGRWLNIFALFDDARMTAIVKAGDDGPVFHVVPEVSDHGTFVRDVTFDRFLIERKAGGSGGWLVNAINLRGLSVTCCSIGPMNLALVRCKKGGRAKAIGISRGGRTT